MKNSQNFEEDIRGRKSKNEEIELYLKSKYAFRFNTIKTKPEFSTLKPNALYIPVSKFDINSFKRELDSVGINTSSENIRTILESDFSSKVHPVKDYFINLQTDNANSLDFTHKLANTVTVANPTKWTEYFKKWLIGVVANAMTDIGCQNHTCLVLTGDQGKFKTTWLDHLCPISLKSYLFTGKIDPQSKDILTLIAEYLFINIDDQLKALNKRDENELKNLITTPAVKYRRPYDIYIEEYPHLASFMASVNGNDFLTDPTGSRRFLPFEVLEIDIQSALNISMDDVFTEIMSLYKQGYRYWFIDEEIEELHRESQRFHVQTLEYESLMEHFEKALGNDESFMTTTQILNELRKNSSLTFSEKRMGEALKKAGFEKVQKRINNQSYPVYGYRIKKIYSY